MSWSHYNPVAVHSGPGIRKKLPGVLPGGKALLITTEGMVRRGTFQALLDLCPDVVWSAQTVPSNPDLDMLDTIAEWHRQAGVDAVVALGGGSAMDSAKALAAILPMRPTEDTPPLSRWLRDGEARGNDPVLPVICLPTTAGTGAEVTPFGTIWDTAHHKKRSVAHPALFPQTALLDPELTLSLPWRETLTGAMDIISHCLETLWNRTATPVSLALAGQALPMVMDALPRAQVEPLDIAPRSALQEASLMAGIAISQSRTALAHAVSYPVTLGFGVPHGLACAFTLPAIAALVSRRNGWPGEHYRNVGERAAAFVRECGLKAVLREYCVAKDVCALVDDMLDPARPDTLTVEAGRDDVLEILRASLEG